LKELAFYADDREACKNAFASMTSDLKKHPETEKHGAIEIGFMMLLANLREARDRDAMRIFILGFR